MHELRCDRLTLADLDAACGLSTEAGWNQTPADWRRLLDLAPQGCLAGRMDGQLVGTATVVGYPPDVQWVGMVLVTGAYRHSGAGTAMFEAALAAAGEGGVLGLDATDLGRPIYLTHGFVDVAQIDRWVGPLRPPPPPPDLAPASTLTVTPLECAGLDEALAFDRAACGVDRGALLARLTDEGAGLSRSWLAREADSGRVVGLAFLRPGRQRAHLGPVLAETEAALHALLAAAAQRLSGGIVLVDAPGSAATTRLLAAHGLVVQRRLTRMTRPGRPGILMGAAVAAATAFEWG